MGPARGVPHTNTTVATKKSYEVGPIFDSLITKILLMVQSFTCNIALKKAV